MTGDHFVDLISVVVPAVVVVVVPTGTSSYPRAYGDLGIFVSTV